jgi:hypothetical protein
LVGFYIAEKNLLGVFKKNGRIVLAKLTNCGGKFQPGFNEKPKICRKLQFVPQYE